MLSKDKRLNLKKDFRWVAAGKKVENKFLKLFLKAGDNKQAKVGIATSGQIFKKASERNRARRLVSAAWEVLYPSLPNNINIIALPKAGVIGVQSKDILLDLQETLTQEGVINT